MNIPFALRGDFQTSLIQRFKHHGARIAVSLVPVIFVVLHASALLPIDWLQRLEAVAYDANLRAAIWSALLDHHAAIKPTQVSYLELVVLLLVGLGLSLALPLLRARNAVLVSLVALVVLKVLSVFLLATYGIALPLAMAVVLVLTAFTVNMSYGYFVESRTRRGLLQLFGTYVPPELVDEMAKNPDSYSMKATAKELTVMFCDMRGFTQMSETMEPTALQALLNSVFSRVTDIIRTNRGTIDKYMGDCVMAFWGAPVDSRYHAWLAVKTSLEIANMLRKLNADHRVKGLPEIGIGIGINTGTMCVGDMGSDIRRSYTVIGDAVNLGSRLEKLTKIYGVDIIAAESTRLLSPDFTWQELDKVRVKGKEKAVTIFWPLAPTDRIDSSCLHELQTWDAMMKAYREQDWDECDVQLLILQRLYPRKQLYRLYAQRVAAMRMLPFDPLWDGATNFE